MNWAKRKKTAIKIVTFSLFLMMSLSFVVPVFGEDGGDENDKEDEEILVRINEIRVTGGSGKTKQDFVELYNFDDEEVDISGWSLRKNTKPISNDKKLDESSSVFSFKEKTILKKGEFFVWANSQDDYAEGIDADGSTKSGSVSDGNEILLVNENDKIIDSIVLPEKAEKREYAFDEKDGKWKWVCNGTPGKENDFGGFEGQKTIRLSEILASPTDEEFIEIENFGDKSIDVATWTIADKSKEKTIGDIFNKDQDGNGSKETVMINPGALLAIASSDSKIAINDSDETIEIRDPCGEIVDTFSYEKSTKEKSWAFDGEKWRETPYVKSGKENVFPESQKDAKIRINEVLANPQGDEETDEYIELYNYGDEEVSLEYWELSDASKARFIFPLDTKLKPKKFLVWYRKDFEFALNNGKETVFLRDAVGNEIDKAVFETAKEDVSWNWNEEEMKWRAGKYHTPDRENRFNSLPTIRKFDIPKEVYDGVRAEFSVEAEDKDGDTLSFRWDFGNGKRSYLSETTHIYRDEGKRYTVILRVSDGMEEVFREQSIRVERFPRRDIQLVALMPNPAGKDSENEWIDIRNEDTKKVNLLGWSIASGKDKESLTNHPIRERIVVKSGDSKKITREDSAFSLRNTSGVVELRRPDGSVADRVEYTKENIAEDELYAVNEYGEWAWSGEKIVEPIDKDVVVEEEIDMEYMEPLVLGVVSKDDRLFANPKWFVLDIERILQDVVFPSRSVKRMGEIFLFTRTGIVSNPKGFRGRCIVGRCPEG
jgi:hypothetical protein